MNEDEKRQLRSTAMRVLDIARHHITIARDNADELEQLLNTENERIATLEQIIEDLSRFE